MTGQNADKQVEKAKRQAERAVQQSERAAQRALREDAQKKREGARQHRAENREKREKRQETSVPPVAEPARMKRRHLGLLFSFITLVVLPTALMLWYLNERAADQYASTVGFSVRKEEAAPSVDIFGGIPNLSSGGTSDTDILYEYIQSQQLVQTVDGVLDLQMLYSKPQNDPVFSFNPDKPIEALVEYWARMVKISYDAGTGLIELRVLAFSADDAQRIAQEVFTQSSIMINQLSAIAREDATRYAREELDNAVERLKVARQAITAFRNETQIVDPSADIQGQMGLVNTLQVQLAEAMIELDLLREVTRESDPRIEQATRRIVVIEARIAGEREKFGLSDGNGEDAYSNLIGEYEALSVDREFAEGAYVVALASYDSAVSEASRKSRYLAAYIQPTLAQSSQYPHIPTLAGLGALFLFLIWAVGALIVYSVKDRR